MRNFIKTSSEYFLSFTRSMEKYSAALVLLVDKKLITINPDSFTIA